MNSEKDLKFTAESFGATEGVMRDGVRVRTQATEQDVQQMEMLRKLAPPDSQISHSDPSRSNSEMSPERMKEIRERVEKATGGKWWWQAVGDGNAESLVATRISPNRLILAVDEYGWLDISAADRAFIAHARQDISDLLAEVERLRAAPLPEWGLRDELIKWVHKQPYSRISENTAAELMDMVRKYELAAPSLPAPLGQDGKVKI